jgi:hypothetical protein
MKKIITILLLCLLLSCQSQEDKITSIHQIEYKDTIINGRSFSPTMIALDKFNEDGLIIAETPTDYRYSDDSTIALKLTAVKKDHSKKITQHVKIDSLAYSFSKDTLTISERYFVHGEYGFVPVYSKTDTSIVIDLYSVVLADTSTFKETKKLVIFDITVAFDAEIITKLAINYSDRKKSIYYKKKKLK